MQKIHPSCFICIWLIFVITLQKINFFGDLAILLLILFSSGKQNNNKNFLLILAKSLYKTKWLFLGIWLSTAFYTPGDLLAENLFWLPTQQGIFSAWKYTARLAMLMACLVWLNSWLRNQDFLLGLFGVLLPFKKIFGEQNIKIFVLRLSLIFQNFENLNADKNNKNSYKFNDLIKLLKNNNDHNNDNNNDNNQNNYLENNLKNFIEISWKKFTPKDFLVIVLAIVVAVTIFYFTKL